MGSAASRTRTSSSRPPCSRRAAGVPVRVQWTRDDELRHAYIIRSARRRSPPGSTRTATCSRGATASRIRRSARRSRTVSRPGRATASSARACIDLPLAIPNARHRDWRRAGARSHRLDALGLQRPAGVRRAVASSPSSRTRPSGIRATCCSRCSARRASSTKHARCRQARQLRRAAREASASTSRRLHRVIERVTQMRRGWGKRAPNLGLAAHRSFLSYIAVVASADVARRAIAEAWIAVDAGVIVNADRVRAQMEGAFVFAMSIGDAWRADVASTARRSRPTSMTTGSSVCPKRRAQIHVDIVRRPPARWRRRARRASRRARDRERDLRRDRHAGCAGSRSRARSSRGHRRASSRRGQKTT